jgi:hypothetical protein
MTIGRQSSTKSSHSFCESWFPLPRLNQLILSGSLFRGSILNWWSALSHRICLISPRSSELFEVWLYFAIQTSFNERTLKGQKSDCFEEGMCFRSKSK